MRKFLFTGGQSEHHVDYLINFTIGEIYREDRQAFPKSPLLVQDAALMYPKDWQEIFKKPDRSHKKTDLGYFAGKYAKDGYTPADAIKAAETLIKLLDEKRL